jgi:lysophospholipid acyltransferase (LPLAT)-like uncharacterized protein
VSPIPFEPFNEAIAAPRVILATCHGMFLHLLPYAVPFHRHKRQLVVLVSPSRDGRLLAAMLTRFGLKVVKGTNDSRGIAGAKEFVRQIESGTVGVIAVDGPRGPCCQAQGGFLRIAQAAKAQVFLAITSAQPGIRFGSWDRAHLPAPFAHLEVSLQSLTLQESDYANALPAVQHELIKAARWLSSPVLPPSLAISREQDDPDAPT